MEAPSPTQGLTDRACTQVLDINSAGGTQGSELRNSPEGNSACIQSVEWNGAASGLTPSRSLLARKGEYPGGHGLYTEIIKSRECVRCHPARSSTDVC